MKKVANSKKTKSEPTKTPGVQKRKNVRFKPDPGTVAYIDANPLSENTVFAPGYVALVAEESFRGCGLCLLMTRALQKGDFCRVKLGQGPVLRAEVKWRAELDAHTIRVGLMYLES